MRLELCSGAVPPLNEPVYIDGEYVGRVEQVSQSSENGKFEIQVSK